MKKTKINLLVNREQYRKLEIFFYRLRVFVVFVVIILSLALLTILTFFVKQKKTISALLEQKKFLLESLKSKENEESKIIFLEKKYSALKEFMKDDAHFLPYYNLLNTALSESTQSSQLKLFKISKNRDVDFIVSFSNFSELMNFFKFVESENFLKNFENITLKSFTINNDQKLAEKGENYELNFTGRFVPINEDKN